MMLCSSHYFLYYSPNSVYNVGVLADYLRGWVECVLARLQFRARENSFIFTILCDTCSRFVETKQGTVYFIPAHVEGSVGQRSWVAVVVVVVVVVVVPRPGRRTAQNIAEKAPLWRPSGRQYCQNDAKIDQKSIKIDAGTGLDPLLAHRGLQVGARTPK